MENIQIRMAAREAHIPEKKVRILQAIEQLKREAMSA